MISSRVIFTGLSLSLQRYLGKTMGQTNHSQRIKLAFVGVAAAAIAVGSGLALWGTKAPDSDQALKNPGTEQSAEAPSTDAPDGALTDGAIKDSTDSQGEASTEANGPSPAEEAIASRPDSAATAPGPSVYWIGSDDNQVQYDAERIAVAPNATAESKLRTAMAELLAGSEATAIPAGTKLLGAEVKGQDVYVDLSGEFTQGGGSAAMTARLGQVIYTATAVEPDAQVWISVDGEPLKELGGEGLLIDQPLDVAKFEKDFGI